jgi:hypothetical protein
MQDNVPEILEDSLFVLSFKKLSKKNKILQYIDKALFRIVIVCGSSHL